MPTEVATMCFHTHDAVEVEGGRTRLRCPWDEYVRIP